jgi:hypothetical protein
MAPRFGARAGAPPVRRCESLFAIISCRIRSGPVRFGPGNREKTGRPRSARKRVRIVQSKNSISDARRRLVERIADSSLFQKPSRLRDLFLYICDYSLQGRNEELREQRIGEVVFGRGHDFRPNDDTIVRVEVRKLRQRLDEYFAADGKDEPILISIPKGAYIASFEARIPVAAPPELASDGRPGQADFSESNSEKKVDAAFVWAVIFGVTTVLFGALAAWYFVRDQQKIRPPAFAAQAPVQKNPLWAVLFNKDQQTYFVCADSALVLYQEITGAPVSLAQYVNRNYPPGAQGASHEMESLLKILPQRQYTNISDVRLVQEILQLNQEYLGHSAVRHARNIQLIDFKNGNFILIGSRRANPWVELFEQSLNFRFVYDSRTQRPGFRNVNPRPNEKSVYWVEGNSAQAGETYSVISFVPNVAHNGSVLMIAGATGEGTEAAGEFTTRLELSQRMLKTIHAIDHDRLRYFEVLLKSGTLGGTSEQAEIVAYRLLPDEKSKAE